MRNICKGLAVFGLLITMAFLSALPARGQGCIVARSSSLDMSPESQGGYLEAGRLGHHGGLPASVLL